MVPPGYKLILYPLDSQRGEGVLVEGANEQGRQLGSNKVMCQVIPELSATKSLRILERREGPATGYWKGITTSEALKFTYHVGIQSADGMTTIEQNRSTLTSSLESGWSASGTASYKTREKQVAREISNTASMDQSVEYKTTCSPKGEGQDKVYGTGLWQWVITTQDYSVSAFTPHTVCRTGELAYQAPSCVFWDCLNHDCSECKKEPGVADKKGKGQSLKDAKLDYSIGDKKDFDLSNYKTNRKQVPDITRD